MGIFGGATDLAQEARQAREQGRTVLCVSLQDRQVATTTGVQLGVSDQIEAVEAAGWRMEQLTMDGRRFFAIFRVS